jgi:hypothetical protein
VLRTSGEVHLRAFQRAHVNVCPSLHLGAGSDEPDTGAMIYAANRLPAEISRVERVILGQLPEDFAHVLGVRLETWTAVQAPARRRQWHYDGNDTLAVHVASTSDIDDVIPTLVAYQIEWNKLHKRACGDPTLRGLVHDTITLEPDDATAGRIRAGFGISLDDWQRLRRALRQWFWPTLQRVAEGEKDFAVRLLGGTHVGYAKLTRRWWQPISAALVSEGLAGRPIYFVSSNLHSLVNLVSGYAPRRAAELWTFLEQSGERDPTGEAAALARLRGQANTENVLYYAARLWHQAHPGAAAKDDRAAEERERGITSIAPIEGLDVGAQVIELSRLRSGDLDPTPGGPCLGCPRFRRRRPEHRLSARNGRVPHPPPGG